MARAQAECLQTEVALLTDPDQLVHDHLWLVETIAHDVRKKLPRHADHEELVGYGQIGLVEASRKFDPSRGILFKTFAYYRVRGAIFDGVRNLSWFGGKAANDLAFEESQDALATAQAARARNAGDAIDFSMRAEMLADSVAALATSRMLSIDSEDGPIEVESGDTPTDEMVALHEMGSMARGFLELLPEGERAILEDFYFNGLNLKQAGEKLGYSRSWAKRLHDRALGRLREEFQAAGVRSF